MATSPPNVGDLPRLNHATAASAVVDLVRTAILDGKFTPGSPLREAHLASSLGTSRATVREAIAQLAEEGLVVKTPYIGASVADISEKDVADIADVRKLVEPFVMESAMQAAEIRPQLEGALQDMAKAAQYNVMSMSVTAHMQFHRIFYEHCGNAIVANMWRSWEGQLQLFFMKDHTVFADLSTVMLEHEHLLGVAYSRDPAALREEVERHVHGSVDPHHWKSNPPQGGHSRLQPRSS